MRRIARSLASAIILGATALTAQADTLDLAFTGAMDGRTTQQHTVSFEIADLVTPIATHPTFNEYGPLLRCFGWKFYNFTSLRSHTRIQSRAPTIRLTR